MVFWFRRLNLLMNAPSRALPCNKWLECAFLKWYTPIFAEILTNRFRKILCSCMHSLKLYTYALMQTQESNRTLINDIYIVVAFWGPKSNSLKIEYYSLYFSIIGFAKITILKYGQLTKTFVNFFWRKSVIWISLALESKTCL